MLFGDLHLLLAARMILLRTERDRPAVFQRVALVGKAGSIPVEKHPAQNVSPIDTRKVSCTVLADIRWTLDSGGIGRR